LKEYGLDSKIQAYDAAYGNSYRYLENLLRSEVELLIEVMSVHQYVSSHEALKKWRELTTQYNKSLWSTEWETGPTQDIPIIIHGSRPWDLPLRFMKDSKS